MYMQIKEHTKTIAREFKKQTITLLLGSFGLVAALAWNDAIKAALESVFPGGAGALWSKFVYAVVFTFILVIVTLLLLRPTEAEKKDVA